MFRTSKLSFVLGGILALAGCSVAEGPLKVGDPAPKIVGIAENGKPFNVQAVWQKRPVVLVFYKGIW